MTYEEMDHEIVLRRLDGKQDIVYRTHFGFALLFSKFMQETAASCPEDLKSVAVHEHADAPRD